MAWLDNSRIAAGFAVVLLHVAAMVRLDSDFGTSGWWAGNVLESVTRWCVPLFVMISGALLLDPSRQETPVVFYKKRMHRILLPLVVWTAFYLGWSMVQGTLTGSGGDIIRRVLSGRPYYHMWFVYMILGLYLFVPFMRMIVASASRGQLYAGVVILFAYSAVNSLWNTLEGGQGTMLFINWFVSYLPYFFLGHLLQTTAPEKIPGPWMAVLLLATGAATAVGYYFTVGFTQYMYEYLSVGVILMSLAAGYLFRGWDKPLLPGTLNRRCANLIFGVYLVHPFMLDLINRLHPASCTWAWYLRIPYLLLMAVLVSWAFSLLIVRTPGLKRII